MRPIPIVILALSVAGCSQSAAPPPPATSHEDGHDHSHKDDDSHKDGHDHGHDAPLTKADVKLPATYTDLVSRVKGYRDEIKASIEAGKPASAHRAFEELNIVLDETMNLAKSAVQDERLAAVNEARQTIRNAFLEIHQIIDAKEKLDYAAKEPAIEAAITTLEQSVEKPPAK